MSWKPKFLIDSIASSVGTLGSIIGSLSSEKKDENLAFVKIVKKHDIYGKMFESNVQYEVQLIHGTRSHLHWIVLLKLKDSKLPYITLEITTQNDLKDLFQTTRTFQEADLLINPNNGMDMIGTYSGTLEYISAIADEVVSEMESYDLIKSNCQNFCNLLLKKMKLIEEDFPTTFGVLGSAEKIDDKFDTVPVVLGIPEKSGKTRIHLPTLTSRPPMNDLSSILTILKPLASKWEEIGSKLHFSSVKLSKIKEESYDRSYDCLKELLTQYLQDLNGHEPYINDLASAVRKVDHTGTRYQKILDIHKTK